MNEHWTATLARSVVSMRTEGEEMEETREQVLADLDARIAALYQGFAYYVPVPRGGVPEVYWGPKADPDGVVRDTSTEHDLYRADLVSELRWIREHVPPGARVLDLGAGSGRGVRVLREYGYNVDAVEPDPRGAELCQREMADGKRVVGKPISEIVWGGESGYDLITCFNVIEHMLAPAFEIQLAVDRLAPGGYLVVQTPDFGSWCARRWGDRFRLLHDPTHVSLFTEDSLLRMIRDCDMTVLDVGRPFFEQARFDHAACLAAQLGTGTVSPAAPGNLVTVYARKS